MGMTDDYEHAVSQRRMPCAHSMHCDSGCVCKHHAVCALFSTQVELGSTNVRIGTAIFGPRV